MRSFVMLVLLFSLPIRTVASGELTSQTPAGRTSGAYSFGVEILPILQVQPGQLQLTTGFSGNRVGAFTPITVKSGTIYTSNLLASGYFRENRWRFGGGVNLTIPITRELAAGNFGRFRLERKVRVGPLVQIEHQTWKDWALFGGYTDSRYTVINALERRIPLTVHQPHTGFKYHVGRAAIAVFGGPSWGEGSADQDRVTVNNKAFVSVGVMYRLGN